MSIYFRFEDLEIWKESINISIALLRIASALEEQKLWRFTDQIRGVAMSIPNNIAESTGTQLLGEQRICLRVSKKECFEAANILVILEIQKLITSAQKENLYKSLSILSRRIQKYSDSLN